MALPKKQLKEKLQNAGVSEELMDELVKWILDGNTASIDAFKEQLEAVTQRATDAEAKVAEFDSLTNKNNELLKEIEGLKSSNEAASKIQAEYDLYKASVEKKEANTAKSAGVRKALKGAGVQREELLDLLMGKVDLDAVEIENGSLKDADSLINPLKETYSSLFATTTTEGTPKVDPPTGGSGGVTRADILKIKDATERQKAIAENIDLFV